MSAEKHWKRIIFRWTTPKGFTAMVLFLTLSFLLEFLLICFFLSLGLTDTNLFTQTLNVPSTSLFFTVTISPLFHLVPLSVTIVLVSSWTYLTKYIAVAPRRIEPAKKTLTTPRTRPSKSRRFRRVDRALKALYRQISAAFFRVRGVSYVLQRLFFARAAVKSTVTILAVFLASFLALCILGYPTLIYSAVIGLYDISPSLLGFVSKTIEMAEGVGQALSPIGQLGAAVNNAFVGAAPGFRSALEGFGAPIAESIVKLDLVWKYIICQNIAAWISSVTALSYGQYATRLYHRHKPR